MNEVIAVLGVSANDKNCCEDSNNSFKATRATIRTDHESLRRQWRNDGLPGNIKYGQYVKIICGSTN